MYYSAMPSRLQVEIKQSKPFVSREHEAILGLLRTAAIVDHATDEALRPFGLTGTQFNVLRILRGAGQDGLCGREIGERMITRVPDVPRLLDRLEKAKLISRERNQDDRRHVTARITQKGEELVERIGTVSMPVEDRFRKLGPEQLDTLIAALDAIRDG
jgi:DNA-binding MarR family transcriptional regulator